jgi:hypothetical protein
MLKRCWLSFLPATVAILFIAAVKPTYSQTPALKETTMHATGSFEVKITPQADAAENAPFARMVFDKQYHGDLEAASTGLMLSAGSPQKGTAGYVAMEKVTGSLRGKTGSFALQHNGTMSGGSRELTVTVTPGSGTGQLEGISGTMSIKIASDGKHSYEFEYALPAHS